MTNGEFHADAIRGIIAETERNTIDRVLEIIDEVAADNLIDDAIKINSVRNRVQMWLKGQTNAEA